MRRWLQALVRRWLGIDVLAGALAEHITDDKVRALELRAEFHRETTALAEDLIKMKPTTTKMEPSADGDPHLGRW